MEKKTNSFLDEAKLIQFIDSGISTLKRDLNDIFKGTDELISSTSAIISKTSNTMDSVSSIINDNYKALISIDDDTKEQTKILDDYVKVSSNNMKSLNDMLSSTVDDISKSLSSLNFDSLKDDGLNPEELRESYNDASETHDDIETIVELLEEREKIEDDAEDEKRSFDQMGLLGGVFSSIKNMIGNVPGLGPLMTVGGAMAGGWLLGKITTGDGGFLFKAMEPFFDIFTNVLGDVFKSLGKMIFCGVKSLGKTIWTSITNSLDSLWKSSKKFVNKFIDEQIDTRLEELGLLGVKDTLEKLHNTDEAIRKKTGLSTTDLLKESFNIKGGGMVGAVLKSRYGKHPDEMTSDESVFQNYVEKHTVDGRYMGKAYAYNTLLDKAKNSAFDNLNKYDNDNANYRSRLRMKELNKLEPIRLFDALMQPGDYANKYNDPSSPNYGKEPKTSKNDKGDVKSSKVSAPAKDSGGVVTPEYEVPPPLPDNIKPISDGNKKMVIKSSDMEKLFSKIHEELQKDKKPKHITAMAVSDGRIL